MAAQNLRDAMFPNGKPEPDEFISAIAELVKAIQSELGLDKQP